MSRFRWLGLVAVSLLLTGCAEKTVDTSVDEKYEICVGWGGSFEFSGVTGSYACYQEVPDER